MVDTRPGSDTDGTVVHETPMPDVGDELHHFGWNRCSSACHGPDRSHLIVPGVARRGSGEASDLGETGLVPLEVRWNHDPDDAPPAADAPPRG